MKETIMLTRRWFFLGTTALTLSPLQVLVGSCSGGTYGNQIFEKMSAAHSSIILRLAGGAAVGGVVAFAGLVAATVALTALGIAVGAPTLAVVGTVIVVGAGVGVIVSAINGVKQVAARSSIQDGGLLCI